MLVVVKFLVSSCSPHRGVGFFFYEVAVYRGHNPFRTWRKPMSSHMGSEVAASLPTPLCIDCGCMIAEKRLKAVPSASLCVVCQEAADIPVKLYNDPTLDGGDDEIFYYQNPYIERQVERRSVGVQNILRMNFDTLPS